MKVNRLKCLNCHAKRIITLQNAAKDFLEEIDVWELPDKIRVYTISVVKGKSKCIGKRLFFHVKIKDIPL